MGFVPFKSKGNGKIGFLRGFGGLVFGLGVSASIGAGALYFYRSQVLYPSALEVNESHTGRYALNKFQKLVNSSATKGLKDYLGEKNTALAYELEYQNKNEYRMEFIKTVLSTVKYTPKVTNKLNKYGSDYYTKGNSIVKEKSYVNFGESVNFTAIDYSKLRFSKSDINELLKTSELSQDDPDFANKITDLFSLYISSLSKDELPLKTFSRKVSMHKEGNYYKVDSSEDKYLDEYLFSSKAFHKALDRFSEAAQLGNKEETTEYKKWASLSDEEKQKTVEPDKYSRRKYISYDWVGVSVLKADAKEKGYTFTFPTGKGTKDSPAGLNTPILTYSLEEGKDGKLIKHPIRVTLLKVSYGSDAIKDIMKADIRNRGIDPKSSLKYIYTEWRVENLESGTVHLTTNSGLADSQGNLSAKTGNMYGLLDVADVEGYHYTEFQDWYSSTELKEKYLVWGKDFDKRVELVWFKALANSDTKVKIPTDPIQTDDISANKNKKTVDTD